MAAINFNQYFHTQSDGRFFVTALEAIPRPSGKPQILNGAYVWIDPHKLPSEDGLVLTKSNCLEQWVGQKNIRGIAVGVFTPE